MIRKHAALLVAMLLITLVAAACIVRTGPPRRGGTVYREAPAEHGKHKPKKNKCHGNGCR
jgi:hypothetical protein